MSTRTTSNPDGTINPTTDAEERRIYSGDQPVSVPASIKINEPARRYLVDTDTGTIREEQNLPTAYRPETPAGQAGVIVRDAIGASIPLSSAKPGDVIDFGPGKGDTTVKVALGLGWIVPSPAGGFMLPGAPGAPVDLGVNERNEQEKQDAATDNPIANPGDLRGVQGTSAESDATIAALQTQAPAALEGIIDSIGAKGVMPDLGEVSQMLGDEKAAEKITQLHSELILAGQTVLKNIDASINPEGFETWLRKSDPDMATTIVRDMLNHSAGSLAQAGRAYLKARDNALETKLHGLGVETARINGALHIAREAVGLSGKGDFRFISVREAEKRGLLTINEG